MRLAALDVSKNRIGIAISDDEMLFVSLEDVLFPKKKEFMDNFKKIFSQYKPDYTFVGLSFSKNDVFIKTFTHGIRYIIGKFLFIDESFSTLAAEKLIYSDYIHTKKEKDCIAARLTLINAMDIMKNTDKKIILNKDHDNSKITVNL
jgi:RNase H-fold protein (predicted Holliday junction resolvase)